MQDAGSRSSAARQTYQLDEAGEKAAIEAVKKQLAAEEQNPEPDPFGDGSDWPGLPDGEDDALAELHKRRND